MSMKMPPCSQASSLAQARAVAWRRHHRAEAFDKLSGYSDYRLPRHRAGHVLGRFERGVGSRDHRLQVGYRAATHGRRRLRFPADTEHDAVRPLTPHDQALDQVGAEVENSEMPVVVVPPGQEFELGQLRACSSLLNASSGGTVSLPCTNSGLPPPAPKKDLKSLALSCRSRDTFITYMSPLASATTPE